MDALIAVTLAAAAIGVVASRNGDERFREDDFIGTVLVLFQTLPVAWRRVAPLGVVVVTGAAIVLYAAMGYAVVQPGTFGSLIAVYTAATLTTGLTAAVAVVATALALGGYFATTRDDFSSAGAAGTAATWAVTWFVGTFVRVRGEQAEAAGARAAALEREREALAKEAVAAERARIARELHDIVGHALNVVVLQAAGAQRVFESRPEAARDSLASIEAAGREALSDMERMLGLLRAADGGGEALAPQPRLASVDNLAAQVSEAGLPVDVSVEGSRMDLPASVDLSAYRIVQEALTNALKHSQASRVRVAIRYGDNSLELDVVDDGRGSPKQGGGDSEGGRGLVGMKERVALFGGDLVAGPAAGGGYRVHARLPFKGDTA
ncbi:MAG: sensor histidine kinase [Chloroflexi bacterium]|nr:sensor histidine kinase [Chloroflexota bacterium]